MGFESIFHGCLSVELENGEYVPKRFTQRQLEFYLSGEAAVYQQTRRQFEDRISQTAGVTLEFKTEAPAVSFAFSVRRFGREWVAFDVYENGVLMKTVRFPDNTGKGVFTYEKRAPGKTELAIYLPAVLDVRLSAFSLGEYEPVDPKKLKYLAMGCSITQGMEAVSPSLSYVNILKRNLDAEVLNQGVGGFVYHPGSVDLELPYEPELVTVAYGTNDCAAVDDLGLIEGNIVSFFDKLSKRFSPGQVYVITPIWRLEYDTDPAFREKMDKIRKIIAREAGGHRFLVISGLHAVPHDTSYFLDGYLHPNNLGFALYANYLLGQLKKSWN